MFQWKPQGKPFAYSECLRVLFEVAFLFEPDAPLFIYFCNEKFEVLSNIVLKVTFILVK